MKTVVAIAVFALSISLAVRADAAPPHTITHSPKTGAPGKLVTLAGQQFVLARLPVRDLGSTRRFAVSFLAAKTGTTVAAPLTTLHSKDPIPDPVQINGFDAAITIGDGRTYHLLSNFITPADDYTFSVTVQAFCTVSIKAGQTLITLSHVFSASQQAAINIGTTPNAIEEADWDAYVHPTPLVAACDNWIDYVRIQEL